MIKLEITAEMVSWYGAIVASVTVIILIVNSMRDRMRISVTARNGYRVMGTLTVYPYEEDKDYISLNVANTGRRPVTITTVGLKLKAGEKKYVLASDSLNRGSIELTEGKSTSYLIDQSSISPNQIEYPFANDATGRIHKGRWIKE